MLWIVEHVVFPGNFDLASSAMDLLKARYRPRPPLASASMRSVVVLPVPANALILRAPPCRNLETASVCSGVGVIRPRVVGRRTGATRGGSVHSVLTLFWHGRPVAWWLESVDA